MKQGMSDSLLPRTLSVLEAGIAEHLHLGVQLYVSVRGQPVAALALGQSRLGIPMRPDTLCLWLSSGKPITSVAIAQLWEDGRLDLDQPVSNFVPEFAEVGKGMVTIRQLLTHTGGIRMADKCDLGHEWNEIIDCVCRTPLDAHAAPGQRAAYHPSGSWYILGEIARRISGQGFPSYVQERVFKPAGMHDCWLALPPAEFQRYGERLAFMYHTDTSTPSPHRKWNTGEDAAVCRPGRNARGPIRELGRFYENLLASRMNIAPDSTQTLLRSETALAVTGRHRTGMFDDTFQQVIDWGLGFALDSKRHGREMVSYGYGRHASDQTFGHGGAQSSCGFADPAHGLVVAWACNGLPGERRHQHRAHAINTALYEDLGLTGES
jgi:CubicO group peptidase (beta-lactamase class C family)